MNEKYSLVSYGEFIFCVASRDDITVYTPDLKGQLVFSK